MNAYQMIDSKNVKYQAMNELTGKRETVDVELGELPAGTKVYEVFYSTDRWMMVPGYELYADGMGGLTIVYDEE